MQNRKSSSPDLGGPFEIDISMRDKAAAAVAAKLWRCAFDGGSIRFRAVDISESFMMLIRICYLTPLIERYLSLSLFLYRLLGRSGWLTVRLAHALGEHELEARHKAPDGEHNMQKW